MKEPFRGKASGKTDPLVGHNHPLMQPCPTCDAIGKELLERIAELEAELASERTLAETAWRANADHAAALRRYHEVFELTGDQEAAEAAARKELDEG